MKRAARNKKQGIKINKKILISALFIFIATFFTIMFLGGFFDGGKDDFSQDNHGQRINLLIAGLDADGTRTDFLMIASYDTATNKVDILSVPENTRMFVGGRYQKISAAHAISENGKAKGISGTVEALNRLTAIPLNYYIEFTTDDFIEFVDSLDGMEFDISENMSYRDDAQDLKINLKRGYQRLNGKKASHAVRYASYDDGSEMRTVTQQEIMKSLAEQRLTPEYVAKLPEIFKKLNLKTNITADDVIKYSNILLKLSAENITFHILPGYSEDSGVTYWIADIDAQKELTQNVFGYDAKNITIEKNKKTEVFNREKSKK